MRTWVPLLVLSACTAPDATQLFDQVEVLPEPDREAAGAHFVEAIDTAGTSLHVALPAGEDLALTDALLAAWDRGVEIEMITDIDHADDAGIAALLDAGVPVTLADDAVTYFDFNLNDDVSWSSEQTIMSHAFVVIDETRMVTADAVGTLEEGWRVVFDIDGEDLIDDVLAEHNQIYGGTDATSLTAYSSLAKSITDSRWQYGTGSDVDLELWFGPQERLTKRIIDAVYGARSSVWVLTDDLANEGLAHALQDKARTGFDVQVIVGPSFGTSGPALSRILEGETPDVAKRQVTTGGHVPTVVLIDYVEDWRGYPSRSRGMVLTHDLYSASRLYRESEVLSDQYIDGALWVLTDDDVPSAEMLALDEIWRAHLDLAEAL